MTKRGASPKAYTNRQSLETDGSSGFQEIERLIGIAGELTAAAEGAFKEAPAEKPAPSANKARFTASKAAICARKQLEELTGFKIDSVSAVSKAESGWEVVINAVELLRIPHSTDVLASFHVQLDEEGNLESYRRSARYTRDQVGEDL